MVRARPMRNSTKLPSVILGVVACICAGCRRSDGGAGGGSTGPGGSSPASVDGGGPSPGQVEFPPDSTDHQSAKAAGLKLGDEIAASGGPPIYVLPNVEAGPLRPRPANVNFYEIRDAYPAYLLCRYDVEESHYDSTKEPALFRAALTQIRNSGQKSFYSVDRGRHIPFH